MLLTIVYLGVILSFFLVLGSFIILIIQYFNNLTVSYILNINYKYIILCFFLFFLYHLWDALRLKTIAEAYKIKYSYIYAYVTSFIATFGATVTPAHMGGELIIFYMLKRIGVKKHKILSIVLFKTVSGFTFFLIALPIILIYSASNTEYLKKVFIVFLIFSGFLILSLPLLTVWKKFPLKKFVKSLKLYCLSILYFWRYKKINFLKASFYSLLLYFTFLNFAPVLLKAFNIHFNWIEIYLIQLPLIYAIFSSPTPGGSGIGELGGAAIFADIIPKNILGLFIIFWRFFSQYLSATLGGVLFLIILYIDFRKK